MTHEAEGWREASGLKTIHMRWSVPYSFMRPSFLENPYSIGGGILYAVEWLQASALDWSPVNFRDEGYTWEMNHLHSVAESALSCFEEFRTVFTTEPLPLVQAGCIDMPRYDAYGRIPARIHKSVSLTVWRMCTTSLYSLSYPPDVDGWKGAGAFISDPLRDKHMAAIAALACCKNSIDGLVGILEFWRGLFKHWLPRGVSLHFDGNHGDPEWDDALIKLREDPSNLLAETERRRDAFAWIERAEAWLAHGDQIEGISKKIETARQSANEAREQAMKEAGESARKRRSEAAKKSVRNKTQAKESRKAMVKKAWLSLQPTQQGRGGVGIVAKRVSLSDKTVRRYLKELGYWVK